MSESKPESNNSVPPSLPRFISERVSSLAKMFAETPLMSLRVETTDGIVMLEKNGASHSYERSSAGSRSSQRTTFQHDHRYRAAGLTPGAEPGQPYETINAEIVGVFHPVPDLPMPGDPVEDHQVLGHIEALKLQNPVRNAKRGTFVSQVVEDGQAVDFGEPLFVIDRGEPAERLEPSERLERVEPHEQIVEPPRI